MLGPPFGSFRRSGRTTDDGAAEPVTSPGADAQHADQQAPEATVPDAGTPGAAPVADSPSTAEATAETTGDIRDRHTRRHPTPVEGCVMCADRSERLLIDHIEPGSTITLDHPHLMERHRSMVSFCSTPGRECPDREGCAAGVPCAVAFAAHDQTGWLAPRLGSVDDASPSRDRLDVPDFTGDVLLDAAAERQNETKDGRTNDDLAAS